MTMHRFTIAAMLLALAGCNDAPEPPVAEANAIAAPNPFNERLRTMQEPLRHATLMRAIIDSGQICKRVSSATYRGAYQNLDMWTATCDGGGQWGIFLGSDASVQVRACGELQQLGLPPCEGPMPKE